MITYRPFRIVDYVDTVTDLIRGHWHETERNFAPDGPCPDVVSYKILEESGLTIAFGAFDDERMVGYVVMFFVKHLHYGFPYSQHDVLFVHKDHRKSSIGLRLMQLVRDESKARGAKKIIWHTKPEGPMRGILESKATLEELIFVEDL